MKFYIDRSEVPIVDATNCETCPPGTKKLRLDRPFRRRFTLKNDGNLPLHIMGISIQNLGCEGYGLFIEGCGEFELESNQEKDLEIKFIPDLSLSYFIRTIVISTNQGNFEFEIHVKMPFKNLYDNFDLYHFKTKSYIKILSYLVIAVMVVTCYKLFKEEFFTDKNVKRLRWRLTGQETLNFTHPNEIFESVLSVKHTLAPVIPAAKLLTAKKVLMKPEKPTKALIKQNEYKEETAINLNKFEDSDGENLRGMKFIEPGRKHDAKRQKKALQEEEKVVKQNN